MDLFSINFSFEPSALGNGWGEQFHGLKDQTHRFQNKQINYVHFVCLIFCVTKLSRGRADFFCCCLGHNVCGVGF